MILSDVQLYGTALLRDTCMATAMHLISAFTRRSPQAPAQTTSARSETGAADIRPGASGSSSYHRNNSESRALRQASVSKIAQGCCVSDCCIYVCLCVRVSLSKMAQGCNDSKSQR